MTAPAGPMASSSSGNLSPVPPPASSTMSPGCSPSRAIVRRRSAIVRCALAS
ncbi:MAG: hypothetical protein ACO3F9_06310 [Burkholderiales bacterium]